MGLNKIATATDQNLHFIRYGKNNKESNLPNYLQAWGNKKPKTQAYIANMIMKVEQKEEQENQPTTKKRYIQTIPQIERMIIQEEAAERRAKDIKGNRWSVGSGENNASLMPDNYAEKRDIEQYLFTK